MTPFQFGKFIKLAQHKFAAGYYPNAGRNEFDDDLDEEIAEVRRMGDSVPMRPALSPQPGVQLQTGRVGSGQNKLPAPRPVGAPAALPGAPLPAVTTKPPPAKPMRPKPPVNTARPLPNLPTGPSASKDLGGFE